MKKDLKPLDEHNSQQLNAYWQLNSNAPVLNGIACPDCNEELYDSNQRVTLTSYPPKKNVSCIKCGYVGYRLA